MRYWAIYNIEKDLFLASDYGYTDKLEEMMLFTDRKEAVVYFCEKIVNQKESTVMSIEVEMSPNFDSAVSKEEIDAVRSEIAEKEGLHDPEELQKLRKEIELHKKSLEQQIEKDKKTLYEEEFENIMERIKKEQQSWPMKQGTSKWIRNNEFNRYKKY